MRLSLTKSIRCGLYQHQYVSEAVAGQRPDYTSLISRLIELALERHAADRALKTSMN